MSRGVYRGIYSALPDDGDFQLLSSDSRLLLLVARICQQAGPAAIFRYYAEILRAQTGLTARRLEVAFVELEAGNWLYRDGPVLWIRNGLRHDPSTTLANENHRKSVNFWIKGLPKVGLVLKFCDYYQLPYPFEAHEPSHDVGPTRSKENESESETDSENEKETTLSGTPDAAPLNGHNGHRNYRAEAIALLEFLNVKAGRAYRPTPGNLSLIEARLRGGATVEDGRGVIARKVRAWSGGPKAPGDKDMRPYLRPKTLFNATNFDQYVGEQGT